MGSKESSSKRSMAMRILGRMKGLLNRLLSVIRNVVTRVPKVAPAYYALASTQFQREQKAVFYGRARYYADLASERSSRSLLRRNIHRIEKGLIMRPLRPVFALEYIDETIAAFEKRARHVDESPEEFAWAQAVLKRYFDTTSEDPRLQGLRERFVASQTEVVTPVGPIEPFLRSLGEGPPVRWDDLLKLAVRRRSIRWFIRKPVPHDLLERAMEVALQSPSACNRQPFVFRAFDDPASVRKIAAIPMGTAGYGDSIPLIIVVVGRMRNYFEERDRHLIYIDGALAAMSFALAAETLGLSTCMINWPDIDEKERELAAAIQLENDERPVMLIAVGFADETALVPASVKRQCNEVLIFEKQADSADCRRDPP